MSQNAVDKVVKAFCPVGTLLTFIDNTDPNNTFEGTWVKLGDYNNVIYYDTFTLWNEAISGTGRVAKTSFKGVYFADDSSWFNEWITKTPSSYYPVVRLGVCGYTGGNATINIFLNNKKTSLGTWSPDTFTARRLGEDWFAYNTLTSEDHPVNIPNSTVPGLNLYYSVTDNTTANQTPWEIETITLSLGWRPYDTKHEWIRTK